ncbi:hypothetical protein LTR78_000199 [Recurvomyces mirabilis]|uniref:DUF1772-domain-containing protein n=1 Tax=Recurvomyces mirabilis TaxID=574656 RepID=A0AAE0WXL1_9PEZI|nr:hypothetical protein LTR78_000199 [Recurvomyces mirabilis]KAK5161856.1 hypothetical protein LTS14_000201 [Recurvomyces mirabilis]
MDTTLLAQAVSISTAFIMSGYMLSASQVTLPLLYPLPAQTTTPLFAGVYHRGASLVIPGTIISTAASAYLAYTATSSQECIVYAAAGAVTTGILPLTAVAMMPGIHRLLALAKSDSAVQVKAQESGEVTGLLKAWTRQNYVRVVMCAVGGGLGLYAAVRREC